MRRLLLPVILVLLLLVGCGAQSGFTSAPTAIRPAGASGGAATAPPGSSPTSAGPSAAAAAGSSGSAPQGEIVIVRTGGPDGTQALLAVDGSTGTRIARMPVGAVDLASATLVTASPEGGLTVVRSIDLRSGRESASTKIAGSWTLPLVVPGALPEGLAASTGQIVLTDSRPAAGTSRFAVLGRDLVVEPRVVTLNGQFAFDAVGPNGQYLFLIEGLGSGHYQVRAYDMTLGRLNEGVIVDKREIGESMEGRPISRGASDDGIWVQTVYVRGDGTAFVHQLETVNGIALCVDLPASARTTSGAAADAWRIAVTGPDGAFVANGDARFVARIASGDVAAASKLGVGSVLALEAGPGGAGDVAYLLEPTTLTVVDPSAHIVGHATSGEAADAAVSPDGSAIYLIGPGARLGRLGRSSGWPVPAGDVPLDPSVDWTGASLVGVLPR